MKEAIKILEQEIAWSQNNRNKIKRISWDWTDGFIKGCEHCLALLAKCEEASSVDDDIDCNMCCKLATNYLCDECLELLSHR